MDKQERTELVDAKKAELTGSLDAHIRALEQLDTTTSFDFDIATDIHKELIDNTTPEGKARLKFWQELYDGLAKDPTYTVTKRYSTNLAPGCYGFGQEDKYEIGDAWVRVYKNLTPDAIVFNRNAAGEAEVLINAPSYLLSGGRGKTQALEETTDPILLFSEKYPPFSLSRNQPEHTTEPEVFFYNDAVELLLGHSDIYDTSLVGTYLPVDWSMITQKEKQNDPRFQTAE